MGVDHSGRKILERTKSLYKQCPERYLCDGRPPGHRESSSRTQVPQQRLWGLRGCWQQVCFRGMMDWGDWKKNHRGLGCRISVSGLRSTNLVYSQLWVLPPDPPGEIVCSVVLSTTAWYHWLSRQKRLEGAARVISCIIPNQEKIWKLQDYSKMKQNKTDFS